MTPNGPFILYALPKSRTTQQIIGGRRIEHAWDHVRRFLTTCTTTGPDQPTRSALTAWTAAADDPDPAIADRIINEWEQRLGAGRTTPIAYAYPSGNPHEQKKIQWDIEPVDVAVVIDYLIKRQPWPKSAFGPIELLAIYEFKLLDPATRTELPDQELQSSLMVWLSRNCVCSPELYFPFDGANERFFATIKSMEPFLPFKLEEKYLRLGRPNKNGNRYSLTKLGPKSAP